MSEKLANFTVGKPFPYTIHNEGLVLLPGNGLHFCLALSGISNAEMNAFKRGSIAYSCASFENIPFVLMDFCGISSFDCYINAFLLTDDEKNVIISKRDSNLVCIYFCEFTHSGQCMLRHIRCFGAEFDFVNFIGETLSSQIKMYNCANDVSNNAQLIMYKYSTKQMIKLSRKIFNTKANKQ